MLIEEEKMTDWQWPKWPNNHKNKPKENKKIESQPSLDPFAAQEWEGKFLAC